ncbi:MAG: DUF4249 family protein [Bacteroidales bacterium]|nr:DUF4249 family protein [Bacteroidales bacterium]
MRSEILKILLILTAFLSSCTGEYDEDISNVLQNKNTEKSISISGTITSEYRKQKIFIFRTMDFSELYLSSDSDLEKRKELKKNRNVRGAKVFVEVAGKKYEFKEAKRTSYISYIDYIPIPTVISIPYDEIYYESVDSFAGIPNQEHKLVVEVEGKTYTATDVMPQVLEISFTEKSPLFRYVNDYREFPEMGIESDTSTRYPSYLFGQQEAHIMGFSTITAYDKEEEAKGNYDKLYRLDDPCFSFRQLAAPQLMGEAIDGGIEIDLDSREYYTDSLLVTKMSCSPAYEYFLYCLFQNNYGNFFDFGDLSSNLPTNISNGGVGFFAACDVRRQFFSRKKLVQLAKSIGNIIED